MEDAEIKKSWSLPPSRSQSPGKRDMGDEVINDQICSTCHNRHMTVIFLSQREEGLIRAKEIGVKAVGY